MDTTTTSTLKEIFKAHGLDPFDAFLMDESEWPAEARELLAQNPAQPKPVVKQAWDTWTDATSY